MRIKAIVIVCVAVLASGLGSFKIEVLSTPAARAHNTCSGNQTIVLAPGSAYGYGYGHIVATCYYIPGDGWHWTHPYWVPW